MIASIAKQTGSGITVVCRVLGVATSTYYHGGSLTETQIDDAILGERIEEIFLHHRRRYGYRRIHRTLLNEGKTCSPDRIRRIMKERGLRAITTRRFVPTTSDGKASAPSPNLLADQPVPEKPNEVWTGDITYIRGDDKWYYLALVMDLGSRRIIGWSIGENMKADLVVKALNAALASRTIAADLIFHSDRGSQYGSVCFRKVLAAHDMRQSMSGRANPYDNSWTESMIGTLKHELIGDGAFASIEDAHTAIFEYTEAYYNTQRLHSSLGYISPSEWERIILTKQ